MKYFEVYSPYYALIKALNKEEAIKLYVKNVADDNENNPLSNEIKEVERDYAAVKYGRGLTDEGQKVPMVEVLKDIQDNKQAVLLVDGALA